MTKRRAPHGTKIVQLPFAGFYESLWSGEIDRQEEYEVENWQDRQAGDGVPETLRVSDADYGEILFRHTDYSNAYLSVAHWYVEAFNATLSGDLGVPLNLQFESMVSPHEYNFGTDRVFAYIGNRAIRELWRISKADGHAMLDKVSGEQFTSRDGFASYYRPDRSDWPADPRDWDHNQLGTLLIAVLRLTYGSPDDSRAPDGEDVLEQDYLWEGFATDDGGYSDWSNAVDWDAVDAAVAERREAIIADLREEAEARGEVFELPYRCRDTVDMFTGQPG